MRRAWLVGSVVLALGCSASGAPFDPAPSAAPSEPVDAPPLLGPTSPSAAPGTWIRVAPGSFVMSRATDLCREAIETEHTVTISRAFEMTRTETTQADFAVLMAFNPATDQACGATCPVEGISWHLAAAYCNALSRATGATPCYSCGGEGDAVQCGESPALTGRPIQACLGYRLPTEAEWEYAYRAGGTGTIHQGTLAACAGSDPDLAAIAWYRASSGEHIHPVAGRAANAFGFFDMSGNVWEWTHDRFVDQLGTSAVVDPVGKVGTARSIRGGSFHCEAREVRGGHRAALPDAVKGSNVGVRCARSLPP